jgi:Leucine-rich repeat (LRR) protein
MVKEADQQREQQELGEVFLDTIPEDTSVAAKKPRRVVNLSSASAVASSNSSRNNADAKSEAGLSDTPADVFGGLELPSYTPEDAFPSSTGKVCNRRVLLFSLVIALLLMGIATGIYFIIGGAASSESELQSPTLSPAYPSFDNFELKDDITSSPSFSPQSQGAMEDIMKEISSLEALENPESPQGICRAWLLFSDPIEFSLNNDADDVTEDRIKQRYILCLLYETTNGAQWTGFFLTLGLHECSWEGIACDTNGKVAVVDLQETNLQGTLPSELVHLQYLQLLRLRGNGLTGSLPDELFDLSKLVWLDVSENYLTGSLSADTSYNSPLESLYLYDNDFTGWLPYFANLEQLWIQQNRFSSLDRSYATSNELKSLIGYNNDFQGTLPRFWSTPVLTKVDLGSNQWQGTIPLSLWTSPNLEALLLNNCQLAGALPSMMSKSLQYIWLQSNRLTGTIPFEFGNELINLSSLQLYDNPSLQGNLAQCNKWKEAESIEADCNLPLVECTCCSKCHG